MHKNNILNYRLIAEIAPYTHELAHPGDFTVHILSLQANGKRGFISATVHGSRAAARAYAASKGAEITSEAPELPAAEYCAIARRYFANEVAWLKEKDQIRAAAKAGA